MFGVVGEDAPLGCPIGFKLRECDIGAREVGRLADNFRTQSFRLGVYRVVVAHGGKNSQNTDA